MSDNELIAEFMGIIQHPTNPKRYYHKGHATTENYGLDELEYDSSWDWLMCVVEKINLIYPKNDFFIHLNILKARIDQVYSAVVEFINWYNSQGK